MTTKNKLESANALNLAVIIGSRQPESWEQRLIAQIASEEGLEIKLLLHPRDDDAHGRGNSANPWQSLALRVLNFHEKLEKRIFLRRKLRTDKTSSNADADGNGIARRELPASVEDWSGLKEEFESLDIALIVNLGPESVEQELTWLPRSGIWTLVCSDVREVQGGPPGFWEVYWGHGVTGVSILARSPDAPGRHVIARAHYNTKLCFVLNRAFIREKSAVFLRKYLRILLTDGEVPREGPVLYANPRYIDPSMFQIMRYCAALAFKVGAEFAQRLRRVLGLRAGGWVLFVGKGDFEAAQLFAAKEVRPNRGEFWADPFIWKNGADEEAFVFFENYEFDKSKGKISVGKIANGNFEVVGDALETDYHLSFPFLFKFDETLYMLPETAQSGRVELWRCEEFPLKWARSKVLRENASWTDTTIFRHESDWWLSTNISYDAFRDHCSELYLFKIDSPLCNEMIPHKYNPVLIDARCARNGGRVFWKDGRLLRFAQDNSYRYGYGLSVMQITELSLQTYEERPLQYIAPRSSPGLKGCHHMDWREDIYVFDGYRRKI